MPGVQIIDDEMVHVGAGISGDVDLDTVNGGTYLID